MMRVAGSLRTQILAIVLGGSILPLAMVGLWLTFSLRRSGEALLRDQLDQSADHVARDASRRWTYRRADVGLIVENEASVRLLQGRQAPNDLDYLERLAESVAETIPSIELRADDAAARWVASPESRARYGKPGVSPSAPALPAVPVLRLVTIVRGEHGARIGEAITSVAVGSVVAPDSGQILLPGSIVAVRDTASGSVLIPFRGSAARINVAGSPHQEVDGEAWLVTRRAIVSSPLEIVIAAPLSPYVAPFSRTWRVGMVALSVVALGAFVLTTVFAVRITRPLEDLATASRQVAAGRFEHRTDVRGPRELQEVARAFNRMADELTITLGELSRRNALAAVGEFATSLSHDVRNALTSIKVDLERVTLRKTPDPVSATLVDRALNGVSRLETTVTGALRVARQGRSPAKSMDLRHAIRAAVAAVGGTVSATPGSVDVDLPKELLVEGDHAALEQLFANLLFNAAQALRPAGEIRVHAADVDEGVMVSVRDSGVGMSASDVERLARTSFSSKHGGTGLGLPIVRGIVAAHGGRLTIDSRENEGTEVRVWLPARTTRSLELHDPINDLEIHAGVAEARTAGEPTT